MQVYRGFDIGCAKPSLEEQRRARHHLIDVVEWHEPFDAQRYCELALAAIADIEGRGARPILCGGTGLYLRALRYGLVEMPPAAPELRERLYAEERAAPGSLYARLQELDRDSAQRIEPHNVVYIVRALEIIETTGEPASKVRERHGFRHERLPMQLFALRWPPEELRARIAERARWMIERGLEEEVRGLLARGVDPECRPMRAVGYKETCEVVLGKAPRGGLVERIETATWAYARRQRTWLRKERGVTWIDVERAEDAAAAVRAARSG